MAETQNTQPINDTVATPKAIFGKDAVMEAMADHIAIKGLGPLITDAKWDRKELTLTVAASTASSPLLQPRRPPATTSLKTSPPSTGTPPSRASRSATPC